MVGIFNDKAETGQYHKPYTIIISRHLGEKSNQSFAGDTAGNT